MNKIVAIQRRNGSDVKIFESYKEASTYFHVTIPTIRAAVKRDKLYGVWELRLLEPNNFSIRIHTCCGSLLEPWIYDVTTTFREYLQKLDINDVLVGIWTNEPAKDDLVVDMGDGYDLCHVLTFIMLYEERLKRVGDYDINGNPPETLHVIYRGNVYTSRSFNECQRLK